jgi:hypothetical protein
LIFPIGGGPQLIPRNTRTQIETGRSSHHAAAPLTGYPFSLIFKNQPSADINALYAIAIDDGLQIDSGTGRQGFLGRRSTSRRTATNRRYGDVTENGIAVCTARLA